MRIWLMIMGLSPIWAGLEFDELREIVRQGAEEHVLVPRIQSEGIGFTVDLEKLRQMKDQRFPDWLIDALVDADVRPGDISVPSSRNIAGSSLFYGRWHSPWPYPLWAYDFVFHDPLYANAYVSWWGWGPYGYSGWYPWFSGIGSTVYRGNLLTPNGYRNSVTERVVGQAIPRGQKTRTKASLWKNINKVLQSTSPRIQSDGGTRSSTGSRSTTSSGRSATRR